MGLNAFTNMVSLLDPTPSTKISKQDYEVFQKEYIFYRLKGTNYGMAFCKRFKIIDPVVKHLTDEDIAKEIIENTYIR